MQRDGSAHGWAGDDGGRSARLLRVGRGFVSIGRLLRDNPILPPLTSEGHTCKRNRQKATIPAVG